MHYTLDGSDPDSVSSPVYDGSLLLPKHGTFKVKAFKKGWISSETVETYFFKAQNTRNYAEIRGNINAMKLLFRSILALATLTALATSSLAQTSPVDLRILAINDFHGYLEPPTGSSGRVLTPTGTVDAGGGTGRRAAAPWARALGGACIDYVPALCTHRPSLLPIEWLSEFQGLLYLRGSPFWYIRELNQT